MMDAALDRDTRQEVAARLARIQHEEVSFVVAYWIDALRAVRSGVFWGRAERIWLSRPPAGALPLITQVNRPTVVAQSPGR